ncbi:MAG: hypothetical protein HYT82_00130 [Candidatus Harrisonbacteria bacterium]|nr:hypothetical protein [Candidatus Harrisonbacteria bacterium]MBI2405971.1 hypothetical protein [Candidatus Harrisonbacteria bacterium]MBI2603956.1 hypothetical protein [Candidatus Harrisonbacteria bacterium]
MRKSGRLWLMAW